MSTAARAARRRDREVVRGDMSALAFGRERFRFTLHREQRRLPNILIDGFVEGCDWERSGSQRTGELNFRRPLTGRGAAEIAKGDRIRCHIDLRGSGTWRRLWQMTVDTPDHQIVEGLLSVAMKSGLKALEQDKVAWHFKRKTARQITLEVARRFHVKVGRLPDADHPLDLFRKSMSPVDVLTKAWAHERKRSGRRFDIDLSRGLIDVVEMREPDHMLLIGPAIVDAAITESLARMTSAVRVTSSRKVRGRRRKFTVRVVDEDRVRRYGYIVHEVERGGLDSEAEARKFAREELARLLKPTGDITFTHAGIPMLDRGDAQRIVLPDADLNVVTFVKAVRHHLAAGSYTMDVTASVTDPWVDERKERARAARRAADHRRRGGANASTSSSPRNTRRHAA